jgi:hypothetical protein
MNTIIYDKYEFKIDITGSQINITLTDTDLSDIYEAIIKEADIYVKPIKKFYSMIEKALNKEPNYNIIITDKKGSLICSFSYNTDMVDIEETITFTKVNTQGTKELLLVQRIKELTELATPVFGYRNFGERMIFNLDSKVLDFRPFDDYTRYPHFSDYNKFTKAKKIIMSTNSKVFCFQMTQIPHLNDIRLNSLLNNFIDTKINTSIITASDNRLSFVMYGNGGDYSRPIDFDHYIKKTNHFDHPAVYLPSVTEVEVFCSFLQNLEVSFTKFGSLPNLEKLSLIQQDNTGSNGAFLDIHSIISNLVNKKLKHIIFKNMSTWIIPDTVDKAKLFAQVNHIKLDII